jgi:hypothetical protein
MFIHWMPVNISKGHKFQPNQKMFPTMYNCVYLGKPRCQTHRASQFDEFKLMSVDVIIGHVPTSILAFFPFVNCFDLHLFIAASMTNFLSWASLFSSLWTMGNYWVNPPPPTPSSVFLWVVEEQQNLSWVTTASTNNISLWQAKGNGDIISRCIICSLFLIETD